MTHDNECEAKRGKYYCRCEYRAAQFRTALVRLIERRRNG